MPGSVRIRRGSRGVVAELLAQLADVHAQVVALGAVPGSPDLAQQVLLREQLARDGATSCSSSVELGAREVHGLAVAASPAAGEVDLEVVDADHGAARRGRCGTRRNAARIRARSSSVSNGFVT